MDLKDEGLKGNLAGMQAGRQIEINTSKRLKETMRDEERERDGERERDVER